jgi:hypothetical protein
MEHEEEDQIRFQKEKEILHIFTVSTLYGLYLCVEIEVQCQCLKSCLNEPI